MKTFEDGMVAIGEDLDLTEADTYGRVSGLADEGICNNGLWEKEEESRRAQC
jgi:hypothetical protein